MRVVLQRVDHAEAREDGELVASIEEGLVLFVGLHRDDGPDDVDKMARKIARLRVFEDGDSMFGRSVVDAGGRVLCLSQFTVMADLSRGRRPNFSRAMKPDDARVLYARFVDRLRAEGVTVEAGPFQSHLVVDVANRGPFTVQIDSRD